MNHGNPDPASTAAHADKCLLGFQVVIADADVNPLYDKLFAVMNQSDITLIGSLAKTRLSVVIASSSLPFLISVLA